MTNLQKIQQEKKRRRDALDRVYSAMKTELDKHFVRVNLETRVASYSSLNILIQPYSTSAQIKGIFRKLIRCNKFEKAADEEIKTYNLQKSLL